MRRRTNQTNAVLDLRDEEYERALTLKSQLAFSPVRIVRTLESESRGGEVSAPGVVPWVNHPDPETHEDEGQRHPDEVQAGHTALASLIEEAVRQALGRRSVRDLERLQQGRDAVFSVRRAAELLCGDEKTNRQWIKEQKGLVRIAPNGKEVVVWGDVLDSLPAREGGTRRPDRRVESGSRAPTGLPRVNLRSLR